MNFSKVNSKEQILIVVKQQIGEVLPDARVVLFGSQANDTAHEESDWDILVIARTAITPQIRRAIRDRIFPHSVSIGAFINLLLVSQKDWLESPSYYSLRKTVSLNSRNL